MTTPIDTFEDILAAMERKPELRDAMRRHVLSEELLQLPAVVAELARTVHEILHAISIINQRQERMESDITDLKAGQAKLEAGQAKLEAGQTKLEAGQTKLEAGQAKMESDITDLKAGYARLEAGQTRMQGQLNGLTGTAYERKVAKRSRRAVRRHLDIRRAELLHSISNPDNRHLAHLLDQAADDGRISDEQADELDEADLILLGRTADDEPIYVVAEVSLTCDDHDVDRAASRARILREASGGSATAAVIGTAISDTNRLRADDVGVAVIIMAG